MHLAPDMSQEQRQDQESRVEPIITGKLIEFKPWQMSWLF